MSAFLYHMREAIRLSREETDENARLKAEVERLSQPAIIGGYNLSQYIRMANSETLEFDNGDIFAEMTLPERIKYIVESHARLKAEVERLTYVDDFIVITKPSIKKLIEPWAQDTPGRYDEEYLIGVDRECYLKILKHMAEFWEKVKEGKQP